MAELENARRSLERATYTPIQQTRRTRPGPGRSWDKWSYLSALRPTITEVRTVAKQLTSGKRGLQGDDAKQLRKLARIAAVDPAEAATSDALAGIGEVEEVSPELLLRFGEELASVREGELNRAVEIAKELEAAYLRKASSPPPRPAEVEIPKGLKLVRGAEAAAIPGARLYRAEESEKITTPRLAKAAGGKSPVPDPEAQGVLERRQVLAVRPPAEAPEEPAPARPPRIPVGDLLDWAFGQDAHAAPAREALPQVRAIGAEHLTVQEYATSAHRRLLAMKDLNYAFAERVRIEPVGLLHLERVSFTPAGIERGELVHSVPLSPGEEVNISHKEWSNTSEEFERIVTDYLEAYSEEGVTEKNELSQSSNSQIQHSSGFNLGVTASGGYGPVSISTTVGFNVSDSASNSQQVARNETNEITRKASARTKKEHKTSFKVASAAGTEDQAVRTLKNPFPDRVTRVDYYQLIRKWRVDLHRYGVRLTYDLAIPEPGSDILTKIVQIQQLQTALRQGFDAPDSTLSWARFDLTPSQVRRDNFAALAAEYGVSIDPPPAEEYSLVKQFTHNWPNKDSANDSDYTVFNVEVPDSYEILGYAYSFERWAWEDEQWHFALFPDLASWLGRWGTLELAAGTKWVSAFVIDLTLTLQLRPAAFEAWQMRAWTTLREAAEARYELNRTMLKNQLAALQEELGAQDALSLRKVEREEVMKGVLRWLFGPTFTFVPPVPDDLYGGGQAVVDDSVWGSVLAQGEVIKFLHHAIEWENVLYFLYPYFWSHTSRWEMKKYLEHPDPMHRAFLKSGSARVVLPIRPGFERSFVSFLETGRFDGLPAGHPYLTIAEEMEAFAKTNYPGIRPANPATDVRPLLSPLQRRAWGEMEGIIALLEQYREAHGAYPSTAEGLAALAELGTVPAADPWGHPYQYKAPGAVQDFELSSLGADSAPGGEDEAADINSWAEASLIGRWYEYTPTSALDIAFDENLPAA